MTPEQIEAAARAMKPRHFETYDRGYTNRNYFEEQAFINAEKVVKRARKDAALALAAAEVVVQQKAAGFESVEAVNGS